MALAKITRVAGRAVPVPGDDIDTDRIIPARYLKCVTFDGLGAHAFHDARFDERDRPLGHPIDDPRFQGATVLVSGRNFGCGSSREHAPQSLYYAGFRAVIAESFAEIFFGNSTTLGIACVTLPRAEREALAGAIEGSPDEQVEIDLATSPVRIRHGERSFEGSMPESTRSSLAEGQWDALGQLLEGGDEIARLAERLPRPRIA